MVRRETVTLPECGVTVRVRGLMAGETHRCGQEKGFRQVSTMVALGTEDDETGKPLFQAHVLEDVQEIEAMHPVDVAFLVKKINELSGGGKMEAMLSDQSTENSNHRTSSASPSPELSAAPSGS